MQQEILINATAYETRVAVLQNDLLRHLIIEHSNDKSIVGDIYLGVVVRVLPAMQVAFVDIGQERTAFLHFNDALPTPNNNRHDSDNSNDNNIVTSPHEGQRIMVQVIAPPIGTKGAKVKCQIAIPARNLVLLPLSNQITASQKIQPESERNNLIARLQEIMQQRQISGGVIIRTVGKNATQDDFETDLENVSRLWQQITTKQAQDKRRSKAPILLYSSLSLEMQIIRDLAWRHDKSRIRVDCRKHFEKISQFVASLALQTKIDVVLHNQRSPIFDLHGVEDAIAEALERRVDLRSGGYLVFDQTEAMTTIDINSGRFLGEKNPEQTALQVNLEAVSVLVRQLILRNISGIIIIDFIHMNETKNCQEVTQTLRRTLEQDGGKSRAGDMSDSRLVEVVRRRTDKSLAESLTETCTACAGTGVQKTAQTVCYEIFREITHQAKDAPQNSDKQDFMVIAANNVIDRLLEQESAGFEALKKDTKRQIRLQSDAEYHPTQFDVVLVSS